LATVAAHSVLGLCRLGALSAATFLPRDHSLSPRHRALAQLLAALLAAFVGFPPPVNKSYLQHRVNCAPSVGPAEEKSHMLRYDVSRFDDFLAIHGDGAFAHT